MHAVLRGPLALRSKQYVIGIRSLYTVWSKIIQLYYNRYSVKKVEKFGADRAAAQWLLKCAASFRPKHHTSFINSKRAMKQLPSNFFIESIDAADSVIHEAGIEYLSGLDHLKELKLIFCHWVDDLALTKVAIYCRNLERLEIIGCGSITASGILACHTLKKLKLLYLCNLFQISDAERAMILAQLGGSLRNSRILFPQPKTMEDMFKMRPP